MSASAPGLGVSTTFRIDDDQFFGSWLPVVPRPIRVSGVMSQKNPPAGRVKSSDSNHPEDIIRSSASGSCLRGVLRRSDLRAPPHLVGRC